MRHGSLFSGIGGFDLGAEWMGWDNVFHCEWNEFGQKVLKHYWPKATSYADITKTDFTIHRGNIDILTGGFPCQPYSQAGKRLGKEDDRHLWPEMLRAIGEIQPRWVVGENVRGLTNWNGGLVFDEVQADLEAKGYKVTPFLLPAVAVNAPHRRDRIWFVAYDASSDRRKRERPGLTDENREQRSEEVGKLARGSKGFCSNADAPNTNGNTRRSKEWELPGEQEQRRHLSKISGTPSEWNAANPSSKRLQKPGLESREQKTNAGFGVEHCNSQITTATDGNRLRRQGDGVGISGLFGKNGPGNDWQNFPTQSPVCNGNDGLPSRLDGITFSKWRNESIKAGGNAIVPQLAYQIFKAIEEYES